MGMTSQGRGRARWIRVLVVVLALTASRTNFPLRTWAASPPSETSKSFATKNKSAKKSEGVIPSRRFRETRQADTLKREAAETAVLAPSEFHSPASTLGTLGARRKGPSLEDEIFSRSHPLSILLRASHVSSLPPPA